MVKIADKREKALRTTEAAKQIVEAEIAQRLAKTAKLRAERLGRDRDLAKRKSDGKGAMAKGRDLEVQHLTETTDLSPKQAKELLKHHGNDWQKVRDEAENFKAES